MPDSREENLPHIIVVGSTNTDLVVSVPHIPRPGETVLGGDLLTVAGGKGANQAVACARLGATVTFIARIGDDAFGQTALAGFRREGIACDYVFTTPGVASGVALIPVSAANGENVIVVAPGANAHLSAEDVRAAASAFDSAKAVVVSLEVPDAAVFEAVTLATQRQIPIILNPAPARSLPPDILAQVSVLTPNETEAAILAGTGGTEDIKHRAQKLLNLGVGCVVVTQGAEGALLVTAQEQVTVAAFAVQAVDTVAAGDCFTGALAVEIARGASVAEAALFAAAASALKVTRRGAQPGIPTRDDVLAFLEERQAAS